MLSKLNIYLLNLNIKITHHPLVNTLLIYLEYKCCVWTQPDTSPTRSALLFYLWQWPYWKLFIYLIYTSVLRSLCLWRTVNSHTPSNIVSVGTCNEYNTYLVFSHLKTYPQPIYVELVFSNSTYHSSYTDTYFRRIFAVTIFLYLFCFCGFVGQMFPRTKAKGNTC